MRSGQHWSHRDRNRVYDSEKVRAIPTPRVDFEYKCTQLSHNKNLCGLVEAPVITVAAVHAKVRRDGYLRRTGGA
jgi:hypothetical protein